MKKSLNVDEQQMKTEIAEKITEMEQPDFCFPSRFTRRDYALAGLLMAFCLGMLLWGVWL